MEDALLVRSLVLENWDAPMYECACMSVGNQPNLIPSRREFITILIDLNELAA